MYYTSDRYYIFLYLIFFYRFLILKTDLHSNIFELPLVCSSTVCRLCCHPPTVPIAHVELLQLCDVLDSLGETGATRERC